MYSLDFFRSLKFWANWTQLYWNYHFLTIGLIYLLYLILFLFGFKETFLTNFFFFLLTSITSKKSLIERFFLRLIGINCMFFSSFVSWVSFFFFIFAQVDFNDCHLISYISFFFSYRRFYSCYFLSCFYFSFSL